MLERGSVVKHPNAEEIWFGKDAHGIVIARSQKPGRVFVVFPTIHPYEGDFLEEEKLETVVSDFPDGISPENINNYGEQLVKLGSFYYASPCVAQLQQWADDGGCETPDGEWVEPDGENSFLRLLKWI